jgi:hypothetical protein
VPKAKHSGGYDIGAEVKVRDGKNGEWHMGVVVNLVRAGKTGGYRVKSVECLMDDNRGMLKASVDDNDDLELISPQSPAADPLLQSSAATAALHGHAPAALHGPEHPQSPAARTRHGPERPQSPAALHGPEHPQSPAARTRHGPEHTQSLTAPVTGPAALDTTVTAGRAALDTTVTASPATLDTTVTAGRAALDTTVTASRAAHDINGTEGPDSTADHETPVSTDGTEEPDSTADYETPVSTDGIEEPDSTTDHDAPTDLRMPTALLPRPVPRLRGRVVRPSLGQAAITATLTSRQSNSSTRHGGVLPPYRCTETIHRTSMPFLSESDILLQPGSESSVLHYSKCLFFLPMLWNYYNYLSSALQL